MVMADKGLPQEWLEFAAGNISQQVEEHQLKAHSQIFRQWFSGIRLKQDWLVQPRVIGGFILGNGDKNIDGNVQTSVSLLSMLTSVIWQL